MMSYGGEELSGLIADIYDAAIDPALWPVALEKLCRFVPGRHANISIQDAVQRSATRCSLGEMIPSIAGSTSKRQIQFDEP
jgi:hypothetical protein